MKAVGFKKSLGIQNRESLEDIEVQLPKIDSRDLLVKILAVSVNPVDVKVRASLGKSEEKEHKIIGWDAVGIVEQVGTGCELFKKGDEVFYAGSIDRQGSNAEYQAVDERIVGKKPTTIGVAEAAALPLTGITAWEALFERLGISKEKDTGKTILIIGGAGGVGSIAIQLAKVAGLQVVATASRAESIEWCRSLGADSVINHYYNLHEQLKKEGYEDVDYILCLNNTDFHWDGMAEAIKPEGKICSIVESKQLQNLGKLKNKSVTFVWEFIFTKSLYHTDNMIYQHELLNNLADWIDEGKIKSTLRETLSPINALNLRQAHEQVEKGSMIGKIVVKDFE